MRLPGFSTSLSSNCDGCFVEEYLMEREIAKTLSGPMIEPLAHAGVVGKFDPTCFAL